MKKDRIGQSAAFVLTKWGYMDRNELFNLYVTQELTQTEIGKIYGCDRKNVDYHIKKYGIPKRTRKEVGKLKRDPRITIEAIEYMVFVVKMLVDEIADYFGVSRTVISERLHEAGYNLKNHTNQRKKQSSFMKENNPVTKGSKRTRDEVEKMLVSREKNLQQKISNFKPTTYREYARFARFLSYRAFEKKVPDGYQIDHIYSIKDGWDNNVPVFIISGPYNLQLLSEAENKKKSSESWITLDELYKRAGVQRLAEMA